MYIRCLIHLEASAAQITVGHHLHEVFAMFKLYDHKSRKQTAFLVEGDKRAEGRKAGQNLGRCGLFALIHSFGRRQSSTREQINGLAQTRALSCEVCFPDSLSSTHSFSCYLCQGHYRRRRPLLAKVACSSRCSTPARRWQSTTVVQALPHAFAYPPPTNKVLY